MARPLDGATVPVKSDHIWLIFSFHRSTRVHPLPFSLPQRPLQDFSQIGSSSSWVGWNQHDDSWRRHNAPESPKRRLQASQAHSGSRPWKRMGFTQFTHVKLSEKKDEMTNSNDPPKNEKQRNKRISLEWYCMLYLSRSLLDNQDERWCTHPGFPSMHQHPESQKKKTPGNRKSARLNLIGQSTKWREEHKDVAGKPRMPPRIALIPQQESKIVVGLDVMFSAECEVIQLKARIVSLRMRGFTSTLLQQIKHFTHVWVSEVAHCATRN